MADQLWTSPHSGHRRRGTSFRDLHRLVEEDLDARSIWETLQSCPLDADAASIRETLERLDFDVAGAQAAQNTTPTGYVIRADLTSGTVEDHVRRFTSDVLVSDSTSITDLLSILSDRPYLFVVVGPDVRGIITPADLNKPPVRMVLFSLISLLEMHMTYWIGASYEDDSWRGELKPGRLKKAVGIQEIRKEANQEMGLLACLQFCDKRDLILAKTAAMEHLGIEDAKGASETLVAAEKLRNSLAHSANDYSQGLGWQEVARVVSAIEAWLTHSDAELSRRAQQAAEGHESALLPAGSRRSSITPREVHSST